MSNKSMTTVATMGIDIGKNSFTSLASIDSARSCWSRPELGGACAKAYGWSPKKA